VKDPDDMRMVCEIVSKFNYEEVIISSFYHKNIFYYKKIYPEIKFAYLYSHEPKNIEEYLNEVDFLKPNINFLTEDYKFYSQKIIPWVVNDNRDFEYIRNFNLYGVITDFPDKLKNFLNKKEFSENYFIDYLLKSIIKEESTFNKDFIKITLKNLFQNITINEIKINDRVLNIGKGYPIIWKVGEKLNLNIENFSLNDKLILNIKEIGIFEIELKDLIKILN
jgi:glycerophosphoryl diester phosphodiesterase